MNRLLQLVLVVSLALFMAMNAEAAKLKQSPALKELLTGDADAAIPMLIDAAEQGDAFANAYLAAAYRDGWGVPIDFAASREHARIAADGGVAAAWLMLSLEFKEDLGDSRLKEAKRSASRLAKKGDPFSAFYLARASENDLGAGTVFNSLVVKPATMGAQYDPNTPMRGDNYLSAKSKKYYKKAADSGYAPSAQMIAVLHITGRGFEKDNAAMMSRIKQAAAQDLAEAQYYLGTLYVTGRGVQTDMDQGLTLLRKAVEKNHAAAQNVLGVLYRDGYGVSEDRILALDLFEKGKSAGNQDAAKNHDELAAVLAHEEADRKEEEDRSARINALKQSHPQVIALAETLLQRTLQKNSNLTRACNSLGINNGHDLLRAPFSLLGDLSDWGSDEVATNTLRCFTTAFYGLSASAYDVIDVDAMKSAGFSWDRSHSSEECKKTGEAIRSDSRNRPLDAHGRTRLYSTGNEIARYFHDCVIAQIEVLVPVLPYWSGNRDPNFVVSRRKLSDSELEAQMYELAGRVKLGDWSYSSQEEDARVFGAPGPVHLKVGCNGGSLYMRIVGVPRFWNATQNLNVASNIVDLRIDGGDNTKSFGKLVDSPVNATWEFSDDDEDLMSLLSKLQSGNQLRVGALRDVEVGFGAHKYVAQNFSLNGSKEAINKVLSACGRA